MQNEIIVTSGEEAFKLGLLIVVDPDPVAEEEETRLFQFRHLLFQEFSARKFVLTVHLVTFYFAFNKVSSFSVQFYL